MLLAEHLDFSVLHSLELVVDDACQSVPDEGYGSVGVEGSEGVRAAVLTLIIGWRFMQQPCTARRAKQVPWTSSLR